jgi:hypothetical protein
MSRFAYTYEDPSYEREEDELDEEVTDTVDSGEKVFEFMVEQLGKPLVDYYGA